ncbi:hypothetical protein [Candidatus Methanodesulfokora washburnensis]|jgi:hypothetical protein|nr:hypothetical protein [Candidatus Methanodesulfokores washburnensis]
MSEVLQITVPKVVMDKIREAEKKFGISKEEILTRAIVMILDELNRGEVM